MLPVWNPRHDMISNLVSKTPFCEEGQRNLSNLLITFDEIAEPHKNQLMSYYSYAVIRGNRVIEGSPTDIGYAERETLPIIFKYALQPTNLLRKQFIKRIAQPPVVWQRKQPERRS